MVASGEDRCSNTAGTKRGAAADETGSGIPRASISLRNFRPGEQLRRTDAMPASNGADGLLARIALRYDRDLYLWRSITTLACAGEDLEPLNTASASIVT